MKKIFMMTLGAVLMVGLAGCNNEENGGTTETTVPVIENPTIDLPVIAYSEVFDQEPEEYFVFFWNATCPASQQFEPFALEASEAGVPIFIVDMADPANQGLWYDWQLHHEIHTVLVGDVEHGEVTFFEGVTADDFPQADGWSMNIVGSYALMQMQFPQNNRQPTHLDELEVAGTPELLRVVDGIGVNQRIGVEPSQTLLGQFGQ